MGERGVVAGVERIAVLVHAEGQGDFDGLAEHLHCLQTFVALIRRQAPALERDDAGGLEQPIAFRTWNGWIHAGILPREKDMSKEEFAAIRAGAGMTYNALADYLGVELRSVQRYESGERSISGPVEKLMRILEKDTKKGKKS